MTLVFGIEESSMSIVERYRSALTTGHFPLQHVQLQNSLKKRNLI